jgi:hypothetical protein
MKNLKSGDQGATIIEFIIVFPLLILFLAGLLMSGIVLSQISWSMQSSFETALLGRANSSSVGQIKMKQRFDTLRGLMGGQLEDGETFTTGIVDQDNARFVEVRLDARVRPLGLQSAAFPLGMTVYAHYNFLEDSLLGSGFSEFGNLD